MAIDNSKLKDGVEAFLRDHEWWAEPGRTCVASKVHPAGGAWTDAEEWQGAPFKWELGPGDAIAVIPSVVVGVDELRTHHALVLLGGGHPPVARWCKNEDLFTGAVCEHERSGLGMASGFTLGKYDTGTRTFVQHSRHVRFNASHSIERLPGGFFKVEIEVQALGHIFAIGYGPYLVVWHDLASFGSVPTDEIAGRILLLEPLGKQIRALTSATKVQQEPIPKAIAVDRERRILSIQSEDMVVTAHTLRKEDGTLDDGLADTILRDSSPFCRFPGTFFARVPVEE